MKCCECRAESEVKAMTREKAINLVMKVFDTLEGECNIEYDWREEHEARDMAIEALEQDAIHIPEGATNGDMIKAIFPNVECGKDELGNVFIISSAQLGYIAFRESWWNAPYKGN